MSEAESNAIPLPYLDVRISALPNEKVQILFINHARKEISSLNGDLDVTMSLLKQLHGISNDPYTPAIDYEGYMKARFNQVCKPNEDV